MDSRTWFAIGGVSTVVASVAVVCLVALTNAAALADSAGAPVSVGPIVVPTTAAGAREPLPTPTVSATAPAPTTAPVAPAAPPEDSAADAETPAPAVDSGATVVSAPAHVIPASAAAALVESRSAGTWDAVREWATSVGWSEGRINAWVARLENEAGKSEQTGQKSASLAPEKKNSGQSAGADRGSRKDQSRDSPVRRD